MTSFSDIKQDLRSAYDHIGRGRDGHRPEDSWKNVERANFIEHLRKSNAKSLIEIGSGTGIDGLFFQQAGFDLTCIDLSPKMVEICTEKGLNAFEMDLTQLDFEDNHFDAAFSLNCLLHLPKDRFGVALAEIGRVLKPGGLFYLALYGGTEQAEVWEGDNYEPKRFFSFHSDDLLLQRISPHFHVISFKTIEMDYTREDLHSQTAILRKPNE